MYKDYFNLREMPFSIAPDPRFLYMSARHRDALAHLLYGVQGEGGILLLTGEVGTGKTTLCRCLLEQIRAGSDVAFIVNPKLSAVELLAGICDEFDIEQPAGEPSVKALVDAINVHLLSANAHGRNAVLIIDEAQNLGADVLEQLRLLTNLETNTRKLLQIVLIGQPELRQMLRRPELRQVAQRIVARYHLGHLTRNEVAAYVAHRLHVSGTKIPIFPRFLIGTLYRLTGGVPRLINLVCDRAMLGTFVRRKLQVTPRILKLAAREALDLSAVPRWGRLFAPPSWMIAAVCGGCVLGLSLHVLSPLSWLKTESAAAAALPLREVRQSLHLSTQTGAAPAVIEHDKPEPVADDRPVYEEMPWPETAIARAQSEKLAFHDLFRLYGLDFAPAGSKASACKAAESANWHCLYARGGLADLLRANQPALLLMEDGDKAGPFHVVLSGLDAQSATVIVAGESRRIALTAIAPLWSGKYALLYRTPQDFGSALSLGSRGPAVAWLRETLAQVQGGDTSGPAVFDADLAGRVKAFQLAAGVEPDGVAGPLTLIHLNLRVDQSLPRLGSTLSGGFGVVHS
jgi:general secretion pathway protein A